MFGALIRPIFKDHELQEKLVQASSLDWTIVRPSAFRDYPADGNYEVGFSSTAKGLKLVISKQDIAKFIVKELTERRFAGTAVSLSR